MSTPLPPETEEQRAKKQKRDVYYDDLQTKFATATIRAADTYSGTSFNYIAYDLKDLLANQSEWANSDMIRCIIDGVKDGLSGLSKMDDRGAFHYIPLSAVEEAKQLTHQENKNRIKKIKELTSECGESYSSVNDLMGTLLQIEEICDKILAEKKRLIDPAWRKK